MQEEQLYRHLLKDAWQLTWKYKVLWLFGLLAVFWGDIGAYQSFNSALDYAGIYTPALPSQAESVRALVEAMTPSALFAALFLSITVLAVLALLIIVTTAARGALIKSIADVSGRKRPRLGAAFRQGFQALWPLLGVAVIVRLDTLLYLYVLNPIVEGPVSAAQMGWFLAVFVVVTLISLILSFLGLFASALIMIEGLSFTQAVKESVALFARNWLVAIEAAVILYIIWAAVGVLAILGTLVLAIPIGLLAFIALLLNAPNVAVFISVPLIVLYIALLIFVASALVTFQYTAWILLFLRLRKQGALAKVVRATARFGQVLHRKIV